MPTKFIRVLVANLKESNVREDMGTMEELDSLGESLAKYQDYPILIRRDLTIVDGHRRARAAKLKGLTELDAMEVDGDLTPDQIVEIQWRTAVQRKGLSDWERSKAVKSIKASHSEWTNVQLAKYMDILDVSMLTRLLAEGGPEVEEAYRTGAIGLSDHYELSQLAPDLQPQMLAFKLSGNNGKKVSRDKLAQATRRLRSGLGEGEGSVKQSRIRHSLSAGRTLVVSGPEMSLSEYIETLQEAIDAAKKAGRESLDIRTAEKVWKSKNKAGN